MPSRCPRSGPSCAVVAARLATCLRGMIRTCVGACGERSRNATASVSWKAMRAWISPFAILQKMQSAMSENPFPKHPVLPGARCQHPDELPAEVRRLLELHTQVRVREAVQSSRAAVARLDQHLQLLPQVRLGEA